MKWKTEREITMFFRQCNFKVKFENQKVKGIDKFYEYVKFAYEKMMAIEERYVYVPGESVYQSHVIPDKIGEI